ncbi:MAG TPA: elongation factor G [Acidimicrobiales bacterium]
MRSFAPEAIRNVALVGHGSSGKTTLAEALLVEAGAIPRPGRVEDGTTTCDFEPEEQRRGVSLALALAPFEWKGHKINLLDTPGSPDFLGDATLALRVADLAVFVISAVDGVEPGARRLWREAAALGVPRMVFVNKLDRDRSSFDATLAELRDAFGAGIAPLELPIGSEGAFHGVADLLSDTAHLYDDGTRTSGPIPDEMVDREHEIHDNLIEGIVVADDDQLERYLGGEVPSVEDLERTLARGVDEALVFPVVCGSATERIGIDRLADFLCEIGPSPLDRPPVEVLAGDDTTPVAPDPTGPPLLQVFRTTADPFVGQIALFRVLSGTLHPDDHLVNPRTGSDERLHSVFTLRGRDHLEVDEVPAGDLAAVAKLSDTSTGDTLAPKHTPVVVPAVAAGEPVHWIAVSAVQAADEDKLATALHRLIEDDPSLAVRRDDEVHQTQLGGQGDLHLAVALERLTRKFGVTVATDDVRIPYRETVTGTGQAEGKLRKQSGGHGQFAVVTLVVEPRDRGTGLEFVDEVVGGAIPRQYIPAVEKGVVEAMAEGGALGLRVVDIRVRCIDGKHHPVDSSEMAFKGAARLALRDALSAAGPVALEPIVHLEVTVPTDVQGEVLGDLSSRRGRVQGTMPGDEGETVIGAVVPAAELNRYATDLRALTGGAGRFTTEAAGHDLLPSHLVPEPAGAS